MRINPLCYCKYCNRGIYTWREALRDENQRLKEEVANLRADRKLAAQVLEPVGPLVGFEASEMGWIGFADAIKNTVADLRSRLEAVEKDTKRLDWLEDPANEVWEMCVSANPADPPNTVHVDWQDRAASGQTFRGAIDAATSQPKDAPK